MANKPSQLRELIWQLRYKWFQATNKLMAAAFNWLGNKLIRRYSCGDEACITCDVGAAHDDLPILNRAFNAGGKAVVDDERLYNELKRQYNELKG